MTEPGTPPDAKYPPAWSEPLPPAPQRPGRDVPGGVARVAILLIATSYLWKYVDVASAVGLSGPWELAFALAPFSVPLVLVWGRARGNGLLILTAIAQAAFGLWVVGGVEPRSEGASWATLITCLFLFGIGMVGFAIVFVWRFVRGMR
jgi:hypothetical protein